MTAAPTGPTRSPERRDGTGATSGRRHRVTDDGAPTDVPMHLAARHRDLPVGAGLSLVLPVADWPRPRVLDVVVGAGFEATSIWSRGGCWSVGATRARTLADTVRADMRLLVCGLNPSVYAADAGVGFARPGNRFWPAAVAAGLVRRERDALDALSAHGVGMTDLVKRATPRADVLTDDEYRLGLARVERLVRWLRPRAVVFVGLAGWRAAVDPRAAAGPAGELGGRPVYLMPSTSGLNAHSRLDDLAEHLRAAAALASAAD